MIPRVKSQGGKSPKLQGTASPNRLVSSLLYRSNGQTYKGRVCVGLGGGVGMIWGGEGRGGRNWVITSFLGA